jgi:serine/threonine protein kinase
MGEVWRARDTRLGRTVAIKFSNAQFTDRFEREARAVAAVNHPNIAAIYEVGENSLVMEYADGLAAAHAAGFVDGDIWILDGFQLPRTLWQRLWPRKQ